MLTPASVHQHYCLGTCFVMVGFVEFQNGLSLHAVTLYRHYDGRMQQLFRVILPVFLEGTALKNLFDSERIVLIRKRIRLTENELFCAHFSFFDKDEPWLGAGSKASWECLRLLFWTGL